MALKIVKGSIDRMFDKNLQDLVRGIRNHKEDEVSSMQSFAFFVFMPGNVSHSSSHSVGWSQVTGTVNIRVRDKVAN